MIGRLIAVIVLGVSIYMVGTSPDTHEFAKADTVIVQPEKKMDTNPSLPIKLDTAPLTASPTTVTEVKKDEITTIVKQPEPTPQKKPEIVIAPQDNETIAWNFFISQGFSREQTAGIMGNLRQEHNFSTSDVPGGLGIAQWLGGRRAALLSKPQPYDINVQLAFIVEELNGREHRAMKMLQRATTVEAATIAFQDGYERCGDCRQAQRINYAYQILGRH